MTTQAIAPGGVIGILGGGQLGRMLAMAAAQLGYRVHVYDPDPQAPAADVAARHACANWDDAPALDQFARCVDVLTYEWENVPVAAVAPMAALCPVRPGLQALETGQDRLSEKRFAQAQGIATGAYAAVASLDELVAAADQLGTSIVLKSRRLGYDGKGQARLNCAADSAAAWQAIGAAPAVAEALVPFDCEISVIVARGLDGAAVHWGPVRNVHKGGILDESTVPAGVDPALSAMAVEAAVRLATALDYVGVLAVEFFVAGNAVLFNEMAPRVHNSGHWTIEGSLTSQFENHIRAICGLPLGAATLTAPRCRMRNLIGADVNDWRSLLADPAARLHLYGKREARAGRKMGHVTWLET